jgi:hypothetical protein
VGFEPDPLPAAPPPNPLPYTPATGRDFFAGVIPTSPLPPPYMPPPEAACDDSLLLLTAFATAAEAPAPWCPLLLRAYPLLLPLCSGTSCI